MLRAYFFQELVSIHVVPRLRLLMTKKLVIVFGNLNNGANNGPFCANANNALSNANWNIASRPSLGGSLC